MSNGVLIGWNHIRKSNCLSLWSISVRIHFTYSFIERDWAVIQKDDHTEMIVQSTHPIKIYNDSNVLNAINLPEIEGDDFESLI